MSLILTRQIETIAADIGRLRRRHPDDPTIENIAQWIDWLDCATYPTAHALYESFRDVEDDDQAITRALQTTDTRATLVRRTLGIHDPHLAAA